MDWLRMYDGLVNDEWEFHRCYILLPAPVCDESKIWFVIPFVLKEVLSPHNYCGLLRHDEPILKKPVLAIESGHMMDSIPQQQH